MGRTRRRRTVVSAALAAVAAVIVTAAPPEGAGAATRTATTPPDETAAAKGHGAKEPRPPRLPRDFSGKGKWVVRDLGITVPFRWRGRNGDSQMIAGGPQYPIWFTNLIYRGDLYTLTYKWPNLRDHTCSKIPGLGLSELNGFLKRSRFVGREILQRNPRRHVNHWRAGVVLPKLPPGKFLRLPLALGDIYVDQRDRGRFWQVLQFGVQNLYDPELDEWAMMDTFDRKPGKVTLPRECADATNVGTASGGSRR
ncbi:hypothetical protein [Streptomyces marispadix]|uniref:Tat pathway signal sequence domain protein n=1 Tax=Streptomyces marispadix TaxID=2922868 RepID=A0ABS9T4G0_9ACTN|nr:hypothetical protein [Streptomyces marispadix]MCH6163407.1 hypothetical protein [Streptomyces marispadix]